MEGEVTKKQRAVEAVLLAIQTSSTSLSSPRVRADKNTGGWLDVRVHMPLFSSTIRCRLTVSHVEMEK